MLVKSRVSVIPEDIIQGYNEVSPATVGHFVWSGYMQPQIRCLVPGKKMVGPAFTVKIVGNDSAAVHVAVSMIEPGDVLVVDRSGDRTFACIGGIAAAAAKARGAAGIIVDGPVTDIQEITELGIPVFATGLSAVTTRVLGMFGEINTTVQCGGTVVEPGDLVFADDNGVLVIKPDDAEQLLRAATHKEASETETLERLGRGELLADLSGASALLDADVLSMIQKLKAR